MHVILVGMKPNGGENTSCVNFRDIPQKMTRNWIIYYLESALLFPQLVSFFILL